MAGEVLILGATGRFGRNAAEAFAVAGWTVRAFDRRTGDLMQDAKGADVIVNAWNPPYPDWAKVVPGATRRVIEAARASAATVMLPGNVYVFGEGSPPVLSESTPHTAQNPLGRIRVEMEAAYRESGVRTILLRGGDFLDTSASGNWFDRVMTKPLVKGRFVYPGRPDIPHAWAYLPDMTRAAVALAARRNDLASFEDIPFPGYTLTGHKLAEAIATVTGKPVRLQRMNWLPLVLARPFWPMARHLLEMRYLWDMPHKLNGARFRALLPEFRETSLEAALAAALQVDIHPDEPVPQ